ncbi:MAG: CBS domain-containing protein [Cyclobacteriaceae bacterium]
MGDHSIKTTDDRHVHEQFIKHLLSDIEALELMLEKGLIESGITRMGAEQEFCLITDNWRPANTSEQILKGLNDPHFTTELARYNLELNLDPVELTGDCFSVTEQKLREFLNKAIAVAKEHETFVLLTGILPTVTKSELVFDYMTPNPRYTVLNEMMKKQRGDDFRLRIRGIDELSILHDSVLFEACNTSFQMHYQIEADDFISSYNWAQAISGPVLGVSTNSPLLLGRELWSETRIALFQQSIDTRTSSYALKDQQARVTFGDSWASGTAADFFKNEIARYRVLFAKEIESNSVEDLERGQIPKLQALCTHNGSIYRWNRPCYGVGGGKPHLRIENRYIPSGPTIIDEMANFAFWLGLMLGRPKSFDDMESTMDFRDAKSNFIKAARTGKESVQYWNGKLISVRDLVSEELLPIAQAGLESAKVDKGDIQRLLGVIEERASKITGSQWSVRKYRYLRKTKQRDDALLALTQSMYNHQFIGNPVHEWPIEEDSSHIHDSAHLINHVMSTQLFTVNENDLADLAIKIMKWKNIHHLPIESESGDLCGLLTHTHIERFEKESTIGEKMKVGDIMTKAVHTASLETTIKEAIAFMKEKEIGCLPVTQGDQLVGIVTIADLIEFDK